MGAMNRRQALAAIPMLVTASAVAAGSPATHPAASAHRRRSRFGIVKHGLPVYYQGRLSCEIDASDTQVDELEVWLPVPTSWREQQVWGEHTFPETEPVIAADGVTRVARWHWPGRPEVLSENAVASGLAPAVDTHEKFELRVEFEWRRSELSTDLDRLFELKFQPYDESSASYRRYTAGETKVPSNHEPIVRAAREFTGGNRPVAWIARDIYRWVLGRTTYQVVDWLGATECLAQKTGACGDYSALFVAACRSVGIPARMNIGFWAAERNGTHVWAEFQLPTREWIPVDPSLDDQGETPGEKYFGWLDANRLTMTKSSDLRLPRLGRGPGEVDFLQGGAHWVWGSRVPTITHEFIGERVATGEPGEKAQIPAVRGDSSAEA